MPRRPPNIVIGIAVPVVAFVLLLAAWAIDSSAGNATVSRNVELGNRDISKLREEKVAAVVKDLSDDFAKTKIRIETSKSNYESTAAELGLEVDQDATVAEALDTGKDDALPIKPFLWLASFASPREAGVRYTVKKDVLALQLATLQGPDAVIAVEPALVTPPAGDRIGVKAGTPGSSLDPDEIAERLVEDAKKGESPIRLSARATEQKPKVDPDQAQKLADDLTAKTAAGLRVRVRDAVGQVSAPAVRSWIISKVENDTLVASIDAEKAKADVLATIGPLSGEKKNASFNVVNGQVQLSPSVEGYTCCDDTTGDRLLTAITEDQPEVELAVVPDKPDFTTEQAEALGIKEPVGTTTEWAGRPQVKSFTTYHACCEPRVTNIHRMADIVRGTIIKPGETFSLNDRVGKRTTANGFVEAGAIADGIHVQEVGGGVSQFSTTLFNAAWFAGLDLMSHQAHSEHFDRYPRGREATLGHPAPDNRIRNSTPYGVLIWTSYTDTSITVTMYSTQNVYGQQTAISESPAGPCTKVTVTRTRYYEDGTTKSESYNALYRPAEGVKCP
jgi:vancomycin resistance protein YoaR